MSELDEVFAGFFPPLFRSLADGRVLGLVPLTYGRARITVGPDLRGYDDAW